MKQTVKHGIQHPVLGLVRARLRYGFDHIKTAKNRQMRFIMLIDIAPENEPDRILAYAYGHIPEEIERWFGDEAYLARWHLYDMNGNPANYIETLSFWHNHFHEYNAQKPVEAVKALEKTTLMSATPGEYNKFAYFVKNKDFKPLKQWAEDRLPLLKDNFFKDMSKAGLL